MRLCRWDDHCIGIVIAPGANLSLVAVDRIARQRSVDQRVGSVAMYGRRTWHIYTLLHGMGCFFCRFTALFAGIILAGTVFVVAAGQTRGACADGADAERDLIWSINGGNVCTNADV